MRFGKNLTKETPQAIRKSTITFHTSFGPMALDSAVRIWMAFLWQCQGGREREVRKRFYKGGAAGEQEVYNHPPYFIRTDGAGFGRKNLDGVLVAMSGLMCT